MKSLWLSSHRARARIADPVSGHGGLIVRLPASTGAGTFFVGSPLLHTRSALSRVATPHPGPAASPAGSFSDYALEPSRRVSSTGGRFLTLIVGRFSIQIDAPQHAARVARRLSVVLRSQSPPDFSIGCYQGYALAPNSEQRRRRDSAVRRC